MLRYHTMKTKHKLIILYCSILSILGGMLQFAQADDKNTYCTIEKNLCKIDCRMRYRANSKQEDGCKAACNQDYETCMKDGDEKDPSKWNAPYSQNRARKLEAAGK